MVFTGISVAVLLIWIFAIIQIARGMGRVPQMMKLEPFSDEEPRPSLSVIIPARDEEVAIRACLESLLAQDYPGLEIIAIDDRSNDATGRIMDEVAEASGDRIEVIHVTELPDGWLGKCHALHVGAERSKGELILFTDGDILFAPGTLSRAVAHMQREGGDMMSAAPELITHGFLESAAVCGFVMAFLTICPIWRATDPRSRVAVGAGAFNLIRREVYEKNGGHRALRMALVDDLALAQRTKWRGGKMLVAYGTDSVQVRWQPSLGEMIRGIEKNSFAALDFSIIRAFGSVGALLLLTAWPWVGLLMGPWLSRGLCLAIAIGLFPLMGFGIKRMTGVSGFPAWGLPIGGVLMAWAIARSSAITLWQGGVRWRGTFHPLRELREFQRSLNQRQP